MSERILIVDDEKDIRGSLRMILEYEKLDVIEAESGPKGLEVIREKRPDIALSSDFIVGFPGEDEEDFARTVELVEDIGFDHSFSIIYSARPGTPAADLADVTPVADKKRRLAELQALLSEQERAIAAAMVGTDQRVLVERPSKKDPAMMAGRTENNRVVNFLGSQLLVGQFVRVRITESLPNSLRGELLTSRAA